MSFIVSFSVPPGDTKAIDTIKKYKKECVTKGLNFSSQVTQAILKHIDEVNNQDAKS